MLYTYSQRRVKSYSSILSFMVLRCKWESGSNGSFKPFWPWISQDWLNEVYAQFIQIRVLKMMWCKSWHKWGNVRNTFWCFTHRLMGWIDFLIPAPPFTPSPHHPFHLSKQSMMLMTCNEVFVLPSSSSLLACMLTNRISWHCSLGKGEVGLGSCESHSHKGIVMIMELKMLLSLHRKKTIPSWKAQSLHNFCTVRKLLHHETSHTVPAWLSGMLL